MGRDTACNTVRACQARPNPTHAPGSTAGVDIGTTSVKAVVADEDGHIVERSRLPSKLVIGPAGRFEHDAVTTWWDSPAGCLADGYLAHRERSGRLGLRHDALCGRGRRHRPAIGRGLLYGDGRGSPARGALTRRRATKWPSSPAGRPGMPLGRGRYWPAQAVANASLGGEGVTDLASAFAAGPLFDGSGWDPAACEAAGLSPAQLPRVAVFGEAIRPGRPVADGPSVRPASRETRSVLGAGSVDGLCEQLVAGTVNDGDVLIGLGSTLVVWLTVPGWPPDVAHLWRVPHLVAGKAMVGGASNAGGIWADWVDRVSVRPRVPVQATSPSAIMAIGPDLRPG